MIVQGADGFSIVYVRCMTGIVISYLILSYNRTELWPSSDFDRDTHFYRMILGGIGIVAFHECVLLLNVHVAQVLFSLNIPLNVLLLRFIGVKSTWTVFGYAAIDFVGIYIVINPSVLTGAASLGISYSDISILGILLGVITALLNSSVRILLSGRSTSIII